MSEQPCGHQEQKHLQVCNTRLWHFLLPCATAPQRGQEKQADLTHNTATWLGAARTGLFCLRSQVQKVGIACESYREPRDSEFGARDQTHKRPCKVLEGSWGETLGNIQTGRGVCFFKGLVFNKKLQEVKTGKRGLFKVKN